MSDSLKNDILKAAANAGKNNSQGNTTVKLNNADVSLYNYNGNSLFRNPQSLNEGAISMINNKSEKNDQ